MRLPNGYGGVIHLGPGRRNPYAARVPIGSHPNGTPKYKYLGYFKTRKEGLLCLADYHNNKEFYDRKTLKSVYDYWSASHFPNISSNTADMYIGAWNYLSALSDMDIQDIRKVHLQKILDDNKHRSMSLHKQIKSLAVQLFDEALENDLVKQNYADFMRPCGLLPGEKEIFTDLEIYQMWKLVDEIPNLDIALIFIFTGYRIGELCDLTKFNTNLDKRVLIGGNKTEAGKRKIVGIYDPIFPYIKRRYEASENYLIERADQKGKKVSTRYLRDNMYYPALEAAGIKKRTPHTCRHTFASLLNRFVDDKKLLPPLMGHTDLEMTLHYTHADYQQMHDTVNLINLPGVSGGLPPA